MGMNDIKVTTIESVTVEGYKVGPRIFTDLNEATDAALRTNLRNWADSEIGSGLWDSEDIVTQIVNDREFFKEIFS